MGTKYDLFERYNNKFKYDITNKARYFAIKMRAPLLYCNTLDINDCDKPFDLIIAKMFDSKPKIKEYHNELEDKICEYNELSYFKECKHKVALIFGYCRLADIRYYIDDIIYIILVFYGNSQRVTDEEVYQLEKIKKEEKRSKKNGTYIYPQPELSRAGSSSPRKRGRGSSRSKKKNKSKRKSLRLHSSSSTRRLSRKLNGGHGALNAPPRLINHASC